MNTDFFKNAKTDIHGGFHDMAYRTASFEDDGLKIAFSYPFNRKLVNSMVYDAVFTNIVCFDV